ncbi:plant UBX domain-containing protein 11 [Pistacia vera]|uniref:plant UBX domain-containing protein 11 n=1 Tax=Pistacia vera TaxID=55513 RepID=UPI001263539F|nr:plant UBX domain-containing protein 11 [Pistacia vera]
MERSLSSLTFKGSIPEAIAEAKKQKKLFVVYISGEMSIQSTWKTPHGLTCAIYPQNSVPCITAIGYNGVQVWKSEGFVSAEVLASNLEKAWLSLHIQETTATVLSAALASKKSEPPPSETSVIGTSEQGGSSGTAVPSPTLQKNVQSSEATSSVGSEMAKENNTEKGVKTSLEFASGSQSGSIEDELSTSSSEAVKDSLGTVMAEPSNSRTEHESFDAAPVLDPVIKRNINHHSSGPEVHSKAISAEAKVAVQYEKADDKNDEKVKSLADCGKVNESSDVHLNIRLHNGVSLREKFDLTSSLRVVKDYVDNQASSLGPYDLAVPYPRKVFSDEDLSKSLSELSLFNRQTLVVVPRQKASSSSFEKTNSSTNAHPSNETAGGYFGYVRRMLSYVNPFSYFSGGANSSSSGQDSQTGIWEYSPNSAFRNNLARRETNDSTSSSRNDSKDGPRTTSAFGSNIHTLKRDEDDDRFSDRNAFWNGNSTQYGGDNNGK